MSADFRPPEALPATGNTNDLGQPVGLWRAIYPNGDRAAEVSYDETGRLIGTAKQWGIDGNLLLICSPDQHDARIVRHATFYGDGTKQSEYMLFDGIPHGPARAWYPDGVLQFSADQSLGRWHGRVKEFGPQGNVVTEELYDFGVPRQTRFQWVGWFQGGPFQLLVAVALLFILLALLARDTSAALGLVILAIVLGVHELGHWLIGRLCGIPIETFRIGIGPQLASFRWRQTLFEIHLIPLLGWVRPHMLWPGELEQLRQLQVSGQEPSPTEGSSGIPDPPQPPQPAEKFASAGAQIAFYSGGIGLNLLSACLALWVWVYPTRPDRAIAKCGEIAVRVATIIPVAMVQQMNPTNFVDDQPGLLRGMRDQSKQGVNFGQHYALLSVVIAVFNLLPIPPLDGYRIVASTYEAISGRPPDQRVVLMLTTGGVVFLIVCMLTGVFWIGRDVFQIFRGY